LVVARCIVKETPQRESEVEVMHDRRATEQRGPTQSDERAPAQGVVDLLADGDLHTRPGACGKCQHIALVWALVAETLAFRLSTLDVAGATRVPPWRNVVG
jgi:hypothetical protein